MHSPSRRLFLRHAAGLAVASTLAGCQTQPASLTPHLPVARLRERGWHQIDEVEERMSEEIAIAGTTQQVVVEAKANVFENTNPIEQLGERIEFDPTQYTIPAESFLAAKARLDPPRVRFLASSDIVLRRALDVAESRATRTLREYGFTNIRRLHEDHLAIESGSTATHRLYRADYPYESSRVTYQGQPLTIESGVITIEAQLAVWSHRGLLVTGAGIYPGEPGRLVATVGGVTHELSLEFEPERYRDDIRELITLIS